MWEELNQLSSYGVCFSTLSSSVLDIDKVWGEISSTFEPSFSSSDVFETFDLDGAQMNVQLEGEIHWKYVIMRNENERIQGTMLESGGS